MGKKKARRPSEGGPLSITSMMDMMTIILCFLLKSYGAQDVTVKANEDLEIPGSSSTKDIEASVSLVVTQKNILVDGEKVVKLEQVQNDKGVTVAEVSDEDKRGDEIDFAGLASARCVWSLDARRGRVVHASTRASRTRRPRVGARRGATRNAG